MQEPAVPAPIGPQTNWRTRSDGASPTKCPFSGMVPIDLKRFLASSVAVVECPDCACTRTLELHRNVWRFRSHNKRKTPTSTMIRRWTRMDGGWDLAADNQDRLTVFCTVRPPISAMAPEQQWHVGVAADMC